MKYSMQELEKALTEAKKAGNPSEVDVTIDPMNRLCIAYTDKFGEDSIVVTLFSTDINKMATLTRTGRL